MSQEWANVVWPGEPEIRVPFPAPVVSSDAVVVCVLY